MSNEIKHFYEFENFRFSPKQRCLWRDGELLLLSPTALEVLNLLLEKHSEVVSREEIIETVWPDTFIEEANLTVAISVLRKTFNRKTKKKFIQTIPKKGYRFVGQVRKVNDKAEREISPHISPVEPKSRVRWHLIAIILLGVFFLGSFSLWLKYNNETGLSTVAIDERKINSVAVLPLKNLDDNEQSRTFSLGLTDNLISRLGKLNRFAVRPLSAVEKFIESEKDALAFGKDLRVDAVIVGTIQTDENRLRLNIRLLDVRDGAQIWSKSFDETEGDIFKLQDDLSLQVADKLVASLTGEDNQKLTRNETQDVEAFKAFSKGQFYLAKRTAEDMERAIGYFEEAIKLDENYAPAYTALADSYLLLSDSNFGKYEPLKNAGKIKKAISRSLELDPSSAETYSTKGFYEVNIEWNIEDALKNYEKSISINPKIAQTHQWYAWALLAQKRFSEAESEMKLAHELDPTSRIIATEMGLPILYAGKLEESLSYFRLAVEMDENFFQARFRLWYALHLSEKYDEAFTELEAMKKLTSEDSPFYLALYAITLAETGNHREAGQILNRLEKRIEAGEYITPVLLASLATILEDNDRAFRWFDAAFRERNDYLLYLEIVPEYKRLAVDERFQKLWERINSV